jgi:hypothetical protein
MEFQRETGTSTLRAETVRKSVLQRDCAFSRECDKIH